MSESFGSIGEWVLEIIRSLGYVGLAALVALETIVPPIPSEVVLPLAGFLCGLGEMSLPIAILAATIGSLVGALVLYVLARSLGEARVRGMVVRYGRWALISEADLDVSLAWFRRHGRASVFAGRLVPAVRSYISIPAGIARMPLIEFVLATTVGSGLWNTILIGAGWLLGDRWEEIVPIVERAGHGVLVVLAIVGVGFFAWRVRDTLRRQRTLP